MHCCPPVGSLDKENALLQPQTPVSAGDRPRTEVGTTAELSYATRGFQTEVAQLLARVDAVPDPALQRLAASVRQRSDVLSSTRRRMADAPDRPPGPRAVFDLAEAVSLAALSWSDSASAATGLTARLPGQPIWVVGNARVAHLAIARAFALLGNGRRTPVGVTVDVSLTRAGARLDLVVPGVELSALSLVTVVEAFLGSTAGPSSAAGVNVQVEAGRVCVITDPVTATTSADETTVAAFWELKGSLDDVA
jgi:hypothetical protein